MTTSSTTAMIHAWFNFRPGGDRNLNLAGPHLSRAGTEVLTGLWDVLAVEAAARPHRAVVEEELGLDAVPLALLQPLDGHRRHPVFVILRTQRSTFIKALRCHHAKAFKVPMKSEPDRKRLALSAVEDSVLGVISVVQSQAVVLHQVDGQGAGPGTQAQPRSARVPWRNTSDTVSTTNNPKGRYTQPRCILESHDPTNGCSPLITGTLALRVNFWGQIKAEVPHQSCCRPRPAQTSALV